MNKIIIIFAMLLISIGIKAEDWDYAIPNWKLTQDRDGVTTGFMQSDVKDKICFIISKYGDISLGIRNDSRKHKSDHKLVLFANQDDNRAIVSFEKSNYKGKPGFTWYEAYVSEGVKEVVNSENLDYVTNVKEFFVNLFVKLEYIDIYIPESNDGDKDIRLTMLNDTDEFYYVAKQMFK